MAQMSELLDLVSELAARYQLTSIRPLLEICQKRTPRNGPERRRFGSLQGRKEQLSK